MGFPRFSHLVIERKLALIRRALSMEDSYTRWAAESILRRGCPGSWTSATLAATSTRPGYYWISSVIDFLCQGDVYVLRQVRVFPRLPLKTPHSPPSGSSRFLFLIANTLPRTLSHAQRTSPPYPQENASPPG